MGGKTILHVDMDAFFASVEQRDRPELRGKPVIVGAGPHERGVVSTCSYEARRYGVRSAMPSRTAHGLCPDGIFLPPRMEAYAAVSRRIFGIFDRYAPLVEAVSIDEAFLDISGTAHLFGGRVALAERLRADVKSECGVTCSAGIGPNRLLAKIASEQRKPDGLFETPFDPEGIRRFLAPKPTGILWGVGKKTGTLLSKYGFRTCGDIQSADPAFLEKILGAAAARSVQSHAFGISDDTVAAEEQEEKSVSREHTFPEDERDRDAVRRALLELVSDTGRRFRNGTRWARTAKLKLRNADFSTETRQTRFETAVRDDISFRRKALELFDAMWPQGTRRTVRLVGFGVTDIADAPDNPEPTLFGPDPRIAERGRRERLSDALDAIRARHWDVPEPAAARQSVKPSTSRMV